MRLHNVHFLGREIRRLLKNRVIDANFADVVEERAHFDLLDQDFRQRQVLGKGANQRACALRMAVGDAIAKYLGVTKQPRSVQKIADALEKGGLPHKSKNLYTTVYTALVRGQGKRFSKVKKDWGLTEWYR